MIFEERHWDSSTALLGGIWTSQLCCCSRKDQKVAIPGQGTEKKSSRLSGAVKALCVELPGWSDLKVISLWLQSTRRTKARSQGKKVPVQCWDSLPSLISAELL